MSRNKKVIISGGGTAGHVYPGIALAEALGQSISTDNILFIGTSSGLEAKAIPANGWSFKTVEAAGIPRKPSIKLIKAIFKLFKGQRQARAIIKDFQPSIVIGTGGFVSVPVVYAAQRMGLPTVIHEQNVIIGLANRMLAKRATLVAAAFPPEGAGWPTDTRLVVTGLPIREAMSDTGKQPEEFGLDPERTTILIFGGSLGAASINRSAIKLYSNWRSRGDLQILHLTGERDYKDVEARISAERQEADSLIYRTIPYTEKMNLAYALADLAVCRAGASTIAELTAAGVPAILVPYPYATGNHQKYNALVMERSGAAVIIQDSDLSAELLNDHIMTILNTRGSLEKMKESALHLGMPDAAQELAALVLGLMDEAREDV